MGIFDKILEFMGAAQVAAAYTPTTAYTGGLPSKTVNKGSKGANVKHVQNFLNWCIKAGLKVDGSCGSKTVAAIKKYQKQYGLKADGSFGAKSKAKAQQIIKAHATAPVVVVKTKQQKAVDWGKKIAADNTYHYVVWKSNDAKTKQCPICHNFGNGKYKGFNCIRFVFACWRHGGGIPCKCEGGLINNAIGQKMYSASDAQMLKLAQDAIGCKDIAVYRNKNGFGDSKLQIGDACLHFEKGVYKHIYLYAGNGQMVDSGNWSNTATQIAVRKRQSCQIIVRYTGK